MRFILTVTTAALLITGPALAEQPKEVEIVDQPVSVVRSREPILIEDFLSFSQGALDEFSQGLFTVPEGKRLVIEYAAVSNTGSSCVTAVRLGLLHTGVTFEIPLVNADASSVGPPRGGAIVKVYAGPGDEIGVAVRRNNGSCTSQSNIQLSGFLEDDI